MKSMMRNKKLALFFSITIVIALCIITFKATRTHRDFITSNKNPRALIAAKPDEAPFRSYGSENLSLKEELTRSKATPEIQAELTRLIKTVRQWSESKGFFTDDELAQYASYNEDVLQALTQNGDLKAILVLTRQLEFKNRYREAYNVSFEGVINGSLMSMADLTRINGKLAGEYYQRGDKGNFKESIVEMVAWDRIAKEYGSTVWIDSYLGKAFTPKFTHPSLDNAEGEKSIQETVERLKLIIQKAQKDNGSTEMNVFIPSKEWQRIKEIDLKYYDGDYGRTDSRPISSLSKYH